MCRVASADRGALAELYDATAHLVFGLAQRILGERSAAEDVVIEVYAHVWQRARDYSAERGMPSTWLLTLTRSRAIDALRARGRERATEPLDVVSMIASDAPNPEDCSAAAERQRFVMSALRRLTGRAEPQTLHTGISTRDGCVFIAMYSEHNQLLA